MFANHAMDAGGSASDLILAVTSEEGFPMQWDSNGDGYVDSDTTIGSSAYPSDLRVMKTGTDPTGEYEFTGEYSTDGGSTWTTIGTVSIPQANSI